MKSPQRRRFDLFALLLMLAPVPCLWIDAVGFLSFRAGALNHDNSFGFIFHIIALAAATCCGIELVRRTWRFLSIEDSRRIFAAIALATAVITWGTLYFVSTSGDEAYLRGFKKWAERNVDIQAIRQWQTKRPTTRGTVDVASTDWPAEIGTLAPSGVYDVAEGTNLQWGNLGRWQHTRGVFVGDSDSAQPPRDTNYVTVEVRPGLHVGVQIGG